MLSFLKQSLLRWRCPFRCQDCQRGKDVGAVPRGELGAGSLIDHEAFEAILERSRIPAVLMLVLVWTVSSVLLILSGVRQYRTMDWVVGQHVPESIFAEAEFSYTDVIETRNQRAAARKRVPDNYRLNEEKTRRILNDVDDFFKWVAAPSEERPVAKPEEKPVAKPEEKPVAKPEEKPAVSKYPNISSGLRAALAEAYARPGVYQDFRGALQMMLNRGINRTAAGSNWRIVGRDGDLTVRKTDTVDGAVEMLAQKLLGGGFESNQAEFRKVLKALIGNQGNLEYDAKTTADERDKAANAVKPVERNKTKGALLIRKGEIYTETHSAMIEAERRAAPESVWLVAFRQMAWSFVALLGGVLALYMFSPDIRRDNLRIMLAGITVAVALAVNFLSIKYLQTNTKLDSQLVVAAVPVAFCAVVLSVVLDLRAAFCCGGMVAVISSLMILPDRSLELALRWAAISSGAALMVHKVRNYRSFFVKAVVTVLVLTFLLNVDLAFRGYTNKELPMVFKTFGWAVLANSAACAILALVMIFVLELLFNLSTDMALMVLSDNHPLVEQLKREAPGTFSHSTAVATLAEDAAQAIGANPLRAKAGALFHDVGKLSKPQYFTENNPNSAVLHDRLKPEESAAIIISHVTEGVKLARKYRLCRFVRNVIATHHGDDLVRFFYYKAQEESKKTGVPVREELFRYAGAPPKSREEGIISLADACEAASRSLKGPTEESLSTLVGNIIQGRFRDGMLRRSRLSAADLEILRRSFTSTLTSMMRGRIAYPGNPEAAGEGKKC